MGKTSRKVAGTDGDFFFDLMSCNGIYIINGFNGKSWDLRGFDGISGGSFMGFSWDF